MEIFFRYIMQSGWINISIDKLREYRTALISPLLRAKSTSGGYNKSSEPMHQIAGTGEWVKTKKMWYDID